MAKRSSGWGVIFIILLVAIFLILGYILISTPSANGPESRDTDSSPGVVRERVDSESEAILDTITESDEESEEVDEDEKADEENEDDGGGSSEEEPEATGETVSNFTYEGGLDADTRARIERIMNESQDQLKESNEYEYLQGFPVLSDDKKTVYFMTATSDHSFVGVYEMVLDGYEWTRIYKRKYDSNPEIAILRVVGREGENLVILAGDRAEYNRPRSDCFVPILMGVGVEDGLLGLRIDEDSSTGLEEYKLSSSVRDHADDVYRMCMNR